jgi:molybdopterin-guanine dinucleotide biosynthesis protein A
VTRSRQASAGDPPGEPAIEPGGVAGIVLAGGASRRFGRDKLAADLDGRPVLHHAIVGLATVVDEIIVAVGYDGRLPVAVDARQLVDPSRGAPPIRVVADPLPDGGPLVGLATALDATDAELAVVVGGDMPSVPGAIVEALLERVRAGSGAAALLEIAELRALPMALRVAPTRVASARCLDAGRRSLRAALDEIDTVGIPESEWRQLDPAGDALRDIDRPADLDVARRT